MTDNKERAVKFYKDLKKHLSNEYLILSERKDAYEADATQIKVEIERRDRTLFPSNEHDDARKYFSPLNLSDIKNNQNSEKEKELNEKLQGVNKEIQQLDSRMNEIMEFLRDADEMFSKKMKINVEKDMNKNLLNIVEYYRNSSPSTEILLECDVMDLKIDTGLAEDIIKQLMINIESTRSSDNVILLEVEKTKSGDKDIVSFILSYDNNVDENVDNVKIRYDYMLK